MSPTEPMRFKVGEIRSVNLDDSTVRIASPGEEEVAHYTMGGTVNVIPKVGELWKYHFSGISFVLDERYMPTGKPDSVVMHEGDAEITVPMTLFIRAASIDMADDEHGYFFDPVTGKLNPKRLP